MTGENKKRFKEFYETITGGNYKILYQNFMAYPHEMQKGVIEAYYIENDIYIVILPSWKKGVRSFRVGFHLIEDNVINSKFLRPDKDSPFFKEYDSPTKATIAAFEEADKLRNKTL
jgi:hypothetical protein